MGRLYLVYKEGRGTIVGGDFVLAWLGDWCAHKGLCQCRLVGRTNGGGVRFFQHHGWHHFAALRSNVVSRQHQFIVGSSRYSKFNWPCHRVAIGIS